MFQIADKTVKSRLLLGTSQYPSPDILEAAIKASKTDIVTVSLRRQLTGKSHNPFWSLLQSIGCHILPNTAGCFSAKEAITTAMMAREIFQTHWIKLEVIGDDYTLHPNSFELVKAAKELIKEGFEVFPYCTDDVVCCRELVESGCRILMPLAAPIGTAKGILNPSALQLLRERFPNITLIVDAGIGKPSQAAEAMEMGIDAVLLNTAVALAHDPIKMAVAFAKGIEAGHEAFQAGIVASSEVARASTPIIGRPFWEIQS
jgi:thiazole synthase